MNFSFYKPQLYQDQEFMNKQGDNFIILNFSSHKLLPNYYPDKYKVIDLPMNVNVWAEDLDILIVDYIRKILNESGFSDIKFQPLIILPQYQPIQLLVLNIVGEMFNSPYPIVTYLRQDQNGEKKPFYIIQSQIRKRVRPNRSDFQLQGLIIK